MLSRCTLGHRGATALGALMPFVHLDAALVVVDKPAGLLAVPGRRDPDSLASRVQARWPDALVVHRLDMATSGLMVFARGPAMQRLLAMAFACRRVDKQYVAVVHGLPVADAGSIDLALAADWPNRPRQRVDPAGGRPSLTHWRVLSRDAAAGTARLLLRPVSGRTHQLRVHLAAVGHPVVGDALYAAHATAVLAPRLLLHASRLAFVHPARGEPLVLSCPAPF